MRLRQILQNLLILFYIPITIAADLPLYDAAVLLESQMPANSKAVLKQGMLQVLVKVSGRKDIGELAIIKEGLAKPEDYLLKYSTKLTSALPDAVSPTGSASEQVLPIKRRVSMQSYLANRIDDLLKKAQVIPVTNQISQLSQLSQVNKVNLDDKITLENKNREPETVNIRINGISSLDAYAKVDTYLSSLPGVDSVKLNKLNTNSLDLVIHTKNGRKALLDTLNQDSQFNQADQADQADQAISQSANDNLLQFRWRS